MAPKDEVVEYDDDDVEVLDDDADLREEGGEEETTEGHAPGTEFPGTSWAELNQEATDVLNETGTLPEELRPSVGSGVTEPELLEEDGGKPAPEELT